MVEAARRPLLFRWSSDDVNVFASPELVLVALGRTRHTRVWLFVRRRCCEVGIDVSNVVAIVFSLVFLLLCLLVLRC